MTSVSISEKKVMVLDTEYETNPKRLLSLAYIIYTIDDANTKEKFINGTTPLLDANKI